MTTIRRLSPDELLELLEGFVGSRVSTAELRIVARYVEVAWSMPGTLVVNRRHDVARRAALALWNCARHGARPMLAIGSAWVVIESGLSCAIPTSAFRGLYDDYVLELLRRDDHLDLDVQRDAWGMLYAELYARLRAS